MIFLKNLISYWLEGLSYLILLAALVFGTLKIDRSIRFKLVCVFVFAISLIALRISSQKGVSNSLQYSFIYLLNTICWSSYFYLLFNSKLKKIVVILITAGTLTYFLYKNVILEFDLIFDSVGQVLSSVGIVALVFIYLHQILSTVKSDPLTQNLDFWIASSQLIYHLGAFGIFLTFNHFTNKILNTPFYNKENRRILTYLWGVHNVLLFLASLLVCVGVFWIVYRKKSKNQPDYKSQ